MKRTEARGKERMDHCYAAQLCSLDSDDEESSAAGAQGIVFQEAAAAGIPVLYDGEPLTLSQVEALWVPVRLSGPPDATILQAVFPSTKSTVETLPGIWDSGATEGVVCVTNNAEFDVSLETGDVIGEVYPAAVQTRVCQACGCLDTDAWIVDKDTPRCGCCQTPTPAGPRSCQQCGAPAEATCALTYAGCSQCRTERHLKGRVRRGPAAGILAAAALTFAAVCGAVAHNQGATSTGGG
jgi:hypothetical protein